MKKAIVLLLISLSLDTVAQETNGALLKKDLQKVYISDDISFHFVSPEPIQYVDISTGLLEGDIPIENICRIKAVPDTLDGQEDGSLGVVTIVGQKFIAQYDVRMSPGEEQLVTQLEILPGHTNPLDVGATPLSYNELKEYALLAYKNSKRAYSIFNTDHDVTGSVNNIYTVDDYVILDITYTNKSNLKFDVDKIRFMIEDQKVLKATNVQSIEIEPVFQLYDVPSFRKRHRNIFIFKKFSFPNNKIFSVELTESQLSGRRLVLNIGYGDLLTADTL